ncbi:MAG TPA: hypothetical protein VFE13_08255 [Caulobacteraceae bacterium]|nr:hypothetical protein [Caulobacteraceae bacterium]
MKAATIAFVGLAAIALTASAAPAAATAPSAFHPARSPTELALARILEADAGKPEQVDPAAAGRSGHRPRTAPPKGAPYLKYLTVGLATAILQEEAQDVQRACGGVYKDGEECGMDSDPVVCAQDFPERYLFRTVRSQPGLAVIEAAWPPDQGAEPVGNGTYRLKVVAGVWKLDGIECAAGDDYNWPG